MSELPDGFRDLEKWCETWCLSGTAARNNQRYASSMEEITSFYNAMLDRADAALAYLSGFGLGSLDREQENLLKLCLSLAEIGPAVEWYGTPEVSDGYDPKLVPLVIEVPENLSQEKMG